MKVNIFVLFALVSLTLFSCTKEDDNSNPFTSQEVNDNVTSGAWSITYYWDTDTDETANFSGYSFNFESDGSMIADNTVNNYPGTWSTGADDSQVKMIISFLTPADFEELSDDWHVVEMTDTKIVLEDVSGGNGGTDYLTFEKN